MVLSSRRNWDSFARDKRGRRLAAAPPPPEQWGLNQIFAYFDTSRQAPALNTSGTPHTVTSWSSVPGVGQNITLNPSTQPPVYVYSSPWFGGKPGLQSYVISGSGLVSSAAVAFGGTPRVWQIVVWKSITFAANRSIAEVPHNAAAGTPWQLCGATFVSPNKQLTSWSGPSFATRTQSPSPDYDLTAVCQITGTDQSLATNEPTLMVNGVDVTATPSPNNNNALVFNNLQITLFSRNYVGFWTDAQVCFWLLTDTDPRPLWASHIRPYLVDTFGPGGW